MMRIKPATRLSLGLMMLTISILFVSDMLGLMPNATTSKLEARKKLCEALAVQFSSAVNNGALTSVSETIKAVVARNDDVQSAALRMSDGAIVARAGDHERLWRGNDADKSTADNVVVPIFKGGQPWAAVEINFASLKRTGVAAFLHQSFAGLVAFVAFLGFVGYWLFMKRALRELDPSGVIPARVKAAFDALAEGVLILDEQGQIVLANAVFLEKAQQSLQELLGRKASNLNWSWPDSANKPGMENMPWNRVFGDGKSHTGVRLTLGENTQSERIFMVNSAPILDDSGNSRGVLSTFDDVTELEHKNSALNTMVSELKEAQKQVESKNKKLHVLATRDPLTECLNRRALNEKFEPLFQQAKKTGTELSCLMVDIDHFKAVNDTYGHNIGDKVIKMVAAILKSNTRDVDLVGRYGGEEFCVVLPDIQIELAAEIADRIRREIETGGEARFRPLQNLTASFGVASVVYGAADTELLIGEADKALYYAKSSGRNRVVSWNKALEEEQTEGTAQDGYLDDLLIGQEASNDDNVNEEATHFKVHISAPEEAARPEVAQPADITALSDLPEKALFCDRVDQALNRTRRSNGVAAVLSVGLDIFRKINYTLGPEAGNRLLLETAARLNHTLRESDTVALIAAEQTSPTILQLNGDEFGVLLTDVTDVESITWIVKRIFQVLGDPVDIAGHKVGITANIGISVYPTDGEDAALLLKNASIARHHAQKAIGQNDFQFFSEELNRASVRQLELESDLRHAIENEEFELHYQPKVCLKTATISGFEALVRWNHPDKGVVPPNDFIPVAEKTQLINVLGDWVLREAMRQTAAWNREYNTDLTIAVNLSPVQFQQKQLVDQVLSMAVAAELDPQLLALEITESTVVEDMEGAIKILEKLRKHGVKVALDDFGTGYSSLNYLKQLPLDCLKIDRSFIMGIDADDRDASIVSTIINLAQSLSLTVVAEGVETHDQLALLCQMNCDEIQGYLFSRPVPASCVGDLLSVQWQATFEQSNIAAIPLAGSQ